MDAFIKASVYEHQAYLATGNGDIWAVWFGHDGQPLLQKLTLEQRQTLRGLQLRYEVWL
jgi:hypothetical protein